MKPAHASPSSSLPLDMDEIVSRSLWGLAVLALLGLSGCVPADRAWVRGELALVQVQVAEVRDRVVTVEQQFGRLDPKVDRILFEVEQLASRQTNLGEPPDHRLVVNGSTFAAGAAALIPAARQSIDAFIRQVPGVQERQLVVVGHTDRTGSEKANYRLAQQRAAAVAHYLLRVHGFDPARVRVTSAGDTQPVADNATAEGRQQNRRVEILVYRDQGQLPAETRQREPPRKLTMGVPAETRQREPPRKLTMGVPAEVRQRQLRHNLTEDQRTALLRTLQEDPKVPLAVVSISGDGESHAFAKELDALFNTAGWATQGVIPQTVSGIPPGLTFVTKSGDAAMLARAVRLQNTLHELGIATHSRAVESMPQGSLMLIVGSQPR
jgi:outer membrane protein OmpA-like peptidoglycan-associated protein